MQGIYLGSEFHPYAFHPHHVSIAYICPICLSQWAVRLTRLQDRYLIEAAHCPSHGGGSLISPLAAQGEYDLPDTILRQQLLLFLRDGRADWHTFGDSWHIEGA